MKSALGPVANTFSNSRVVAHRCWLEELELSPIHNGGVRRILISTSSTPADLNYNPSALSMAIVLNVALLVGVAVRLTNIAGLELPQPSTVEAQSSAIVGLLAVLPAFMLSRFSAVRDRLFANPSPRRVRYLIAAVAVTPMIPCIGVIGNVSILSVGDTRGYLTGYLSITSAIISICILAYSWRLFSDSGLRRLRQRQLKRRIDR